MDPRYTGEVLRHLEKESELLMEAHRAMSQELHRLQVEEEMLMRKFYELMSAQGIVQKRNAEDNLVAQENDNSGAMVNVTSDPQ